MIVQDEFRTKEIREREEEEEQKGREAKERKGKERKELNTYCYHLYWLCKVIINKNELIMMKPLLH